jgi:Superinfection immunity protein
MRLMILLAALYFLPAIVGHAKRDFTGILLVNLFLGWTVIGWIAALIWALCAAPQYAPVLVAAGGPGVRFCSRCGAQAPVGAHFCWACGERV